MFRTLGHHSVAPASTVPIKMCCGLFRPTEPLSLQTGGGKLQNELAQVLQIESFVFARVASKRQFGVAWIRTNRNSTAPRIRTHAGNRTTGAGVGRPAIGPWPAIGRKNGINPGKSSMKSFSWNWPRARIPHKFIRVCTLRLPHSPRLLLLP